MPDNLNTYCFYSDLPSPLAYLIEESSEEGCDSVKIVCDEKKEIEILKKETEDCD